MKHQWVLVIVVALVASGCASDTQRAYQRAEQLDTPEAWQAVLALPEDERVTAIAKERYSELAEQAWAEVDTTSRAAVDSYIERFLPSKPRDEALLTRLQLLRSDAQAERKLTALLDFRDELDSLISVDAFAEPDHAMGRISAQKQQLDALILSVAGEELLGFGLETLVLLEQGAGETADAVASADTQRAQGLLKAFEISAAMVSPYSLTLRSEPSAQEQPWPHLTLSLLYRDREIHKSIHAPQELSKLPQSRTDVEGKTEVTNRNAGHSRLSQSVCFAALSFVLKLFDEDYAVPRLVDYLADEQPSRSATPCTANGEALKATRGGISRFLQRLELERQVAAARRSQLERERRLAAIDQLVTALEP